MTGATPETSHGTLAKRGGGIILAGQALKLGVQLGSLVVLSRLLTPADFGLVAMIGVFLALGEVVRDFGLTQAALQTPHLSDEQSNMLFWVNLGFACVLALILTASMPLIEALYSQPGLGLLGACLSLVFVLSAIQAQSFVLLARAGRFAAMTLTDIGAQVVGLAAAVVLATGGAGAWALVGQTLTAVTVLAASRIALSRFRPFRPKRTPGMAGLYRYGIQLSASQLLTYAAGNADNLIVGVNSGASQLGLYSRAFQLVSVPIGQLLGPLTNAVLPILSRSRHEHGNAHGLLLKAQIAISGAVTFPLVALASAADIVVPLVLGNDWSGAIPIVRILLYGACIQVLLMVSFWAFLTAGLTRQLLFYNLVTKPLHVLLIWAGSPFGLSGVAWGYVGGLFLSWPISLVWLARHDGLPWGRFVRCASITAVAATLSHLVMSWTRAGPVAGDESFGVPLAVSLGLIVYLGVVSLARDMRHLMIRTVRRPPSIPLKDAHR